MSPRGIRTMLVVAAVTITALAIVQFASARADRQTATTIQVKGGEFFFRLSKKSIAKPTKVTFAFMNIGSVPHDFRINGKTTPLIQPGKTAKLVITFTKKGKFPYLCTVPGHAQAGMKGVFTVA
jgi:uncharacterized cupredoxin-like copper-binding protein